jgi:hypothetical protein
VQPLQLTLRSFLSGWLRETFEADGRLGRTIKPMFLRPGYLAREYVAGRRVHYTSPLKLFVFSAVIGFLLLSLFYKTGVKININTNPGTHGDSWFGQQMDLLTKLGPQEMYARLENSFYEVAPTVLALMLPLFAVVLKLLYWRRGYIEHVVFALHQHAVLLMVMVPLMLTRWPPVIIFGLVLSSIHMLLALRIAYPRGWPATILTWAVAVGAYSLLALGGIFAAFLIAIATS